MTIRIEDDAVITFGKEDGVAASVGSDKRKLAMVSDSVLGTAVSVLHRRHKRAVVALGVTKAGGKIDVASSDLPNHVDLYTKEQVLDEIARRKSAAKAKR